MDWTNLLLLAYAVVVTPPAFVGCIAFLILGSAFFSAREDRDDDR